MKSLLTSKFKLYDTDIVHKMSAQKYIMRGFALIELLAAFAIIKVLSSITLKSPNFFTLDN